MKAGRGGGFYVRTSIPSRTSEMHLVVRLGQTVYTITKTNHLMPHSCWDE